MTPWIPLVRWVQTPLPPTLPYQRIKLPPHQERSSRHGSPGRHLQHRQALQVRTMKTPPFRSDGQGARLPFSHSLRVSPDRLNQA